jgi:hypothetical protein
MTTGLGAGVTQDGKATPRRAGIETLSAPVSTGPTRNGPGTLRR